MGFTSAPTPRSVRDAMFLSPTETDIGMEDIVMNGTLKLKTLNEDGLYSWETSDYVLLNVGKIPEGTCWILRNSSKSQQPEDEKGTRATTKDILLSDVCSVDCRGGAGCRFDLKLKNGTLISFLTIDSNECTQWVTSLSSLANNEELLIPETTEPNLTVELDLNVDTRSPHDYNSSYEYESRKNVVKNNRDESKMPRRKAKTATAIVPSHKRLLPKKKNLKVSSNAKVKQARRSSLKPSRLTRPTTSSRLKAGTRRLQSNCSMQVTRVSTKAKAKSHISISKPKPVRTQRSGRLSKNKKINVTTPLSRVSVSKNDNASNSPATNNSHRRKSSKSPLRCHDDGYIPSITNPCSKEDNSTALINVDPVSEQLMKVEALLVQERAKYARELREMQKALVLESQRCEELRNELCEMAEKRVEDQVAIAALTRKLRSQNL